MINWLDEMDNSDICLTSKLVELFIKGSIPILRFIQWAWPYWSQSSYLNFCRTIPASMNNVWHKNGFLWFLINPVRSVHNNVSYVRPDREPFTLPHLQLSASSIKINSNHSLEYSRQSKNNRNREHDVTSFPMFLVIHSVSFFWKIYSQINTIQS